MQYMDVTTYMPIHDYAHMKKMNIYEEFITCTSIMCIIIHVYHVYSTTISPQHSKLIKATVCQRVFLTHATC